ncbi:MAG: hypothetical protein JW384_02204 [Nitrosomonadaceae bacterium]|nr:hypothetical protein [Nitrosomonadaceae bacterium]
MAAEFAEGVTVSGSQLTQMLAGQQKFLENIFSLMRFLEGELTKRGLILVKPSGYGVTRNGKGTGLANFTTAEWVTTQIGVTFVSETEIITGTSKTIIPSTGLHLLAYQVRWLEKAPIEPVIWFAWLLIMPLGTPKKWEEFQSAFMIRLEASRTEGGFVTEDKVMWGGSGVRWSGSYRAVPVTDIQSAEDAITKLVEPALKEWAAHSAQLPQQVPHIRPVVTEVYIESPPGHLD